MPVRSEWKRAWRGALLPALAAWGLACGGASPEPSSPVAPEGVETLGWPLRPASSRRPDTGGMVRVAAGPFVRGYDVPPLNRDEYPKAKVTVSAFLIDRGEVTVADYARCVRDGACDARGAGLDVSVARTRVDPDCNWGRDGRALHPMNCVSWADAYGYCAWAGKRMPTETEWEKAARGADDERQAPWGSLADLDGGAPESDAGISPPRANLADRALRAARPAAEVFAALDDGYVTTAPVGSFRAGASPCGALDMLGNVAEWVFDWYDPDAYFRSAGPDPSGPALGTLRVYRGHAWSSNPSVVRITRRSAAQPTDRDASTGFRCALDDVTLQPSTKERAP